jgi:hypothetical protein
LEAAGREHELDSVIAAAELGTKRGEKTGTHRGEEIISRELGADPVLGHGARDHVVRGERHDRHRSAGGRWQDLDGSVGLWEVTVPGGIEGDREPVGG